MSDHQNPAESSKDDNVSGRSSGRGEPINFDAFLSSEEHALRSPETSEAFESDEELTLEFGGEPASVVVGESTAGFADLGAGNTATPATSSVGTASGPAAAASRGFKPDTSRRRRTPGVQHGDELSRRGRFLFVLFFIVSGLVGGLLVCAPAWWYYVSRAQTAKQASDEAILKQGAAEQTAASAVAKAVEAKKSEEKAKKGEEEAKLTASEAVAHAEMAEDRAEVSADNERKAFAAQRQAAIDRAVAIAERITANVTRTLAEKTAALELSARMEADRNAAASDKQEQLARMQSGRLLSLGDFAESSDPDALQALVDFYKSTLNVDPTTTDAPAPSPKDIVERRLTIARIAARLATVLAGDAEAERRAGVLTDAAQNTADAERAALAIGDDALVLRVIFASARINELKDDAEAALADFARGEALAGDDARKAPFVAGRARTKLMQYRKRTVAADGQTSFDATCGEEETCDTADAAVPPELLEILSVAKEAKKLDGGRRPEIWLDLAMVRRELVNHHQTVAKQAMSDTERSDAEAAAFAAAEQLLAACYSGIERISYVEDAREGGLKQLLLEQLKFAVEVREDYGFDRRAKAYQAEAEELRKLAQALKKGNNELTGQVAGLNGELTTRRASDTVVEQFATQLAELMRMTAPLPRLQQTGELDPKKVGIWFAALRQELVNAVHVPPMPADAHLAELAFADGVRCYLAGNYQTAAAHFTRAIESKPRDARFYYYRALSRFAEHGYDGGAPVVQCSMAAAAGQECRRPFVTSADPRMNEILEDVRRGFLLEQQNSPSASELAQTLRRVQGNRRVWLNSTKLHFVLDLPRTTTAAALPIAGDRS
ncbi:MAG: hypothetical protein QM775_24515 [Pirellulales bacterium]